MPVDHKVRDEATNWASALHELRGPAFVTQGFADLLVERWDQTDNNDLRDMALTVQRNANRMLHLVQSLLVDARVDADTLALQIEDHLLGPALDVAHDVAAAYGAEIKVMNGRETMVRADPYRVEQILGTLVENACCHGVPPVTVTTTTDGPSVTFVIRDDGPRIDAASTEHLFDQFSPLARKRGSNGLGLHTARRLARAMQGDVVYLDDAAAFALTLPAPS